MRLCLAAKVVTNMSLTVRFTSMMCWYVVKAVVSWCVISHQRINSRRSKVSNHWWWCCIQWVGPSHWEDGQWSANGIMSCPPVNRRPRHPFLWDRAEGYEAVVSRVPLMTLLGAFIEFLRRGRRHELLRLQWGQFQSTLKNDDVKHKVVSNKPETFVSVYFILLIVLMMAELLDRCLRSACIVSSVVV